MLLIRFYQAFISPRKGYGCPYRLHYGGSGCSGTGYRLVRRYGLIRGWFCLKRRFAYCRYAAFENRPSQSPQSQRGDCDVTDFCDVADCACDLFEYRRNGQENGRPPKKRKTRRSR